MPAAVARGLVAALVAAAAFVAYREGGGADIVTGPPRAQAAPASAASRAPRGEDAYEVKLRLADALAEAHVDAPNLRAGIAGLVGHWRKMRDPWTLAPGDTGRLLWVLGLRTSEYEQQWSVPLKNGSWTPEARVWNMNEGTYDQREAILAPTPATISFKVTVPQRAKLAFAPAVVMPSNATTIFRVSVVDLAGGEHPVYQARVQAGDVHRWIPGEADLSEFAGQRVELRLTTAHERPLPNERHWIPAPDPDKPPDPNDAPQEPPGPPVTSVAAWGNPELLGRSPTTVPYNVLWIVIDALRPDVISSFHDPDDEAKKLAAPYPPLGALLPDIPGLMPNIDALAARGVRFLRAYSAGAWTRPGTLAMLTGMRSSELAVGTVNWTVAPEEATRFYAEKPPLLPLLLRENKVETRAFVNNFFMSGYAAVGLDMGFERVDDMRYRTRDTQEITAATVDWLHANRDRRFFLFCNYNSPHDPYEPPEVFKKRVPRPPAGPEDPVAALYMAEGAKDDEAVGVLTKTLDALDLTRNTLVIVTSDHGETLSLAHAGLSSMDKLQVRYHHAVSDFEETTHIPIVMALPGVLDGGKAVRERVRNVDLTPTVLDLEGLEANPRMSGKSMMPLVRGGPEPDERVVVSEGRNMRAVIAGKWRLLERSGSAQLTFGYPAGANDPIPEELFDLDEDPGERHNLAKDRPDVVAEMHARLDAALKNVPAAGTQAAMAGGPESLATLHLRFSGAGAVHRVSGKIVARDAKSVTAEPVGIAREALRIDGDAVEVALTTVPDAVIGLDVRVDPPGAPVAWELYLDDQPWPDGAVFAGPFGLVAKAAKKGLVSDEARAEVYSPTLAEIDPVHDLGVFVTRDRRGEGGVGAGATQNGEATKEMSRLLQEWGYAHGKDEKR